MEVKLGVRIGGTATVKADGTQFALKGNLQVVPSAVEREGIAGQDYVHGYLERPIVPSIKGDFSTVPGFSLEDMEAMTDVTVQADLANGSSYILSDAWTVAKFMIDTVRGQVEIHWEGTICSEIVS